MALLVIFGDLDSILVDPQPVFKKKRAKQIMYLLKRLRLFLEKNSCKR